MARTGRGVLLAVVVVALLGGCAGDRSVADGRPPTCPAAQPAGRLGGVLGAAVRRAAGPTSEAVPDPGAPSGPRRVPFGPKVAWVAARGVEPGVLADALGLRRVQDLGWEGVDRAYEQGGGVYVTPPVDGWTLAMGVDLSLSFDREWPDLAGLSERLGAEVQYFESSRVVELHGWGRAEGGVLRRAFRYVGESDQVLANTGTSTAIEAQLGVPGPKECEVGSEDSMISVDEDTVMAVALAWSVDPTSLAGPDESLGVLGELPGP